MTTREEAIEVMNRLTKEIEGRRSMSRFVKDDPETKLYADALNVLGFLISPPEPTEASRSAQLLGIAERLDGCFEPTTPLQPILSELVPAVRDAIIQLRVLGRSMPLQDGAK